MMEQSRRQKIAGFFEKHKPNRAFFLSGIAAAGWAAGYVSPELTQSVLSSGFAEALTHAPLVDTLAAATEYFRGAASYTAGLARGALDGFTALGSDAHAAVRVGLENIALDGAAISQVIRNELRDRVILIAETAAIARTTAGDAISALGTMLPKTPSEFVPWCVTAGTAVIALHEKITKLKDVTLDTIKVFRFMRKIIPGQSTSEVDNMDQALAAGVTPQVMGNMTINIAIGGDAVASKAILTLAKAIQEKDSGIVADPEKLMARLEEAIAIDDIAKRNQEAEEQKAKEERLKKAAEEIERQQEATRKRAIELFSRVKPDALHSDVTVNPGKLLGLDKFDEFSAQMQNALRADSAVNAILHGDVLARNVRTRYRLHGVAEAANDDQIEGVYMNKLHNYAKTAANDLFPALDAKKEISDTNPDLGTP